MNPAADPDLRVTSAAVEAAGEPARVEPAPRLRPPRWLPALAWIVLGSLTAFLFLRHLASPPYSPDSWGYYELSRHVDRDFFRIDTYRNYQSPHPYGASFGPLWPLLIRLFDVITRSGAQAGYFAAFACLGGTAAVIEGFGRRVVAVRGLGPVVALGLLAFPPYVDEVLAARSFPLAVLLLCLLLWATSAVPDRGMLAAVAAGAAAAGLLLTRTDTFLALLLLGPVLVAARRRRPRWRPACGAVAVFAVLTAPWALYGLAHFGAPLAADNAIIASAVAPHYVTDVIDVARTTTLPDDPLGWLARVAGNAPELLDSWVRALIAAPVVVATALIGLLLWVRRRSATPSAVPLLLAALGCFLVEITVAALTTGYRDHRYLTLPVLLALLVAVLSILHGEVPRPLAGRRAGAVIALALLLLPAAATVRHQVWHVPGRVDTLDGGAVGQELARCHDGSFTLVVGGTDGVIPARHGALTGRPSGFYPANMARLSVAQRREWVHAYRIGFLYLPPAGRNRTAAQRMARDRSLLAAAVILTPDSCARLGLLYRVALPAAR